MEGTGLYAYGFRYYDPVIGRFSGVDPLAQDFAAWSSYNYVFGNPLRYVDPDGRSADDIIIRTENITGDGYIDQVIIKSDKIDQTIDLPFAAPGSFHSLSLSPKASDPIVIDIRDPIANLDLDGLIEKLTAEGGGEPIAAITMSLGATVAVEEGFGGEVMIASILEGSDRNESHLYVGGSAHVGVDASAGVTIGLVRSRLPLSQFNAETLAGAETGWNGSVGPVGTGAFTGYDFPSFTKTYTGKSYSVGVGVKELPGGLTACAGWAERLGKIQSF